jgi:outer membrane protein OmpA-like peptidoglycan-associated protein
MHKDAGRKPTPGNARRAPATVQTTTTVEGSDGRTRHLDPQSVSLLQRAAGNAAVAALLGGAPDTQPSHDMARDLAQRDLDESPSGKASAAHGALPPRGAVVQRDLAGSFLTSQGVFDLDIVANNGGATATTGMNTDIKFTPSPESAYTNKLGIVQVVKLTDDTGGNIDPASMPATTGPSVRTVEDKAKGVEGGFFTDVLHQNFANTPPTPQAPGSAATPYYQGGTPIFGFKRSDDAQDIKAAEITDFPGVKSDTAAFDFSFETVAKGDDNQLSYGTVKWSFGIRKGAVVNEAMAISDDTSPTFDAALEAHRDFYVHEPMTFYFGFDSDAPEPGETDKIDTFLDYLKKFPDVQLNLAAFADIRGRADYNQKLALRRANAMAQALLDKGVAADRIQPLGLEASSGATDQFTTDAVDNTPAGQDREANRRGNRRVTLTFIHTASSAPAGGTVL